MSQAGQAGLHAMVPALVSLFREGPVGSVVSEVNGVSSADDLRSLVSAVSGSLPGGPTVVALGTLIDGRGTVVVAASSEAVAKGAHAGDMVKVASGTMGGGGGGKPQLAQGGGPDGAALATALANIETTLDSLR